MFELVCGPPVLRYPSPKPPSDKNQDKHDASRFRADLAQLICWVLVDRWCSSCLRADRGQNAEAATAAPVVCNLGTGTRQADQTHVIMSGIADKDAKAREAAIDDSPTHSRLSTPPNCAHCVFSRHIVSSLEHRSMSVATPASLPHSFAISNLERCPRWRSVTILNVVAKD
jgi:hypothetical protein